MRGRTVKPSDTRKEEDLAGKSYLGQVAEVGKAVGKHAPEINFPLNITWSGNILFACVVAFWICCVAIRSLRPESSFGAFLNSPDGVAAAFIGSFFFAAIAGAVLEKFGYPIAKKGDKS